MATKRAPWKLVAGIAALAFAIATSEPVTAITRTQATTATTIVGVAPASTAPPQGTPVAVGDVTFHDDNPSERESLPAHPLDVDGPALDVATEQATNVVFVGRGGQSLVITANRTWTLEDPLGTDISSGSQDRPETVALQDSGRYLLRLGAGLRPPATVRVRTIDPNAIVRPAAVGAALSFQRDELRRQVARVRLRGGQRYRLVVPGGQPYTQVCASDWSGLVDVSLGCVSGVSPEVRAQQPNGIEGEPSVSFITDKDIDASVTASFLADLAPETLTARIDEAANDVVADVSTNPVVDQAPAFGQSIVVPFWGSPAERAVLSSPTEALVAPWGQPWIDRETGGVGGPGASGSVKVFAVPVVFDPAKAPFALWRWAPNTENRQRVAAYRGEDTAVTIPATGQPTPIRNRPWFASVGSLRLEAGSRYVLQVTGKAIRPISLAVRDPSGKFTSNLSPWQWSEDNGEQRALTTISADRAGLWALEARPAGNAAKDLSVSLLKVGSGVSYEGSIDVDEVLSVGDRTDVQLGPNEFARFTVKLASAVPQIIQPDVQRYRNKTFQPTAVDMSLWDSRGRLVWSNNRNLEEEVLSGRLGKEPELSERFATVASADPYTLVVDPHTDLAGRFRIGVTSTPVFSDVPLGAGTIPVLLDGTRTGVVEVRSPQRFRLVGADACLSATSTAEWAGRPHCLDSGTSIALPVGVHRFTFTKPLTGAATFAPVALDAPADPVETVTTAIDAPVVSLSAGKGFGVLRFNVSAPGTRVCFTTDLGPTTSTASGIVLRPDGTRVRVDGSFVAGAVGDYSFLVGKYFDRTQRLRVISAVNELQLTTLALGAPSKILTMTWGQRVEATVTVGAKTHIGLDTFGDIRLSLVSDTKERRFVIVDSAPEKGVRDTGLTLPPGTYRFVFEGNGSVRAALKRLPLR